MNEHHNPWKIISEKPIYDNKWINVTEYDVINPSGGKVFTAKCTSRILRLGLCRLMTNSIHTW
jgi:hypothetical protein